VKKKKMQSISSQTPEGIVGNGGILEVTVTVNAEEEDRGRQREERRVERRVRGVRAAEERRWPKSVRRIS
jgi:hypothetical protein